MLLYELTTEEQALEEQFLESGGELTPELEERLQLAEEDFFESADKRVRWVRDLLARAEARKAEASKIQKLAASDERLANWLTQDLKNAMERRNKKRINLRIANLTVVKNSKPSIRAVVPIEELPEEFREVVPQSLKFSYAAAEEYWRKKRAVMQSMMEDKDQADKVVVEVPGCEVKVGTHLRGVK